MSYVFYQHHAVVFFILSDNLCPLNGSCSLLTFDITTVDIAGVNLASYFVLSICLTYCVYFSFSPFSLFS